MNDKTEGSPQPRKILIADDDPAVLRMLADRCMKMGFMVETAVNGVQLLVKARQSAPDVLIVDVNMPALDGLSVCARLLDAGHKPIDVIVITGTIDPETVERCDSLGIYLGRKGPDFWQTIEAALCEIYSELSDRLEQMDLPQLPALPLQPRVLVVDDDPDIHSFFAGQLAKYGIDTLYAENALQACRLALKEKPSVIIADNYMPGGDAQYLLYRLRATPATADIPVVVISGNKLNELTERMLKREICGRPGALQIFRKSFDTDALFAVLQKFCSFKKARALPAG